MLNEEEIAARRIPVEDAELNLSKAKNWHCHYCNHRFTNEVTFMKHHCEPKRRAQELMTPIGQAAFGYYREWMRMKRYSQPGAAAFMESKYYRSFINFAQLVADANISKPEKYMSLMIEADVLPILWCREQCYAVYLEWMDKIQDPLSQVQDSINYLMDLCEKENVELGNVAAHLGGQRIISLIRQRRLSPWFVFNANTFKAVIRSMDKSQLSAFNVVVNSGYWAKRFQEERETVENINHISQELGL